MKEKHKYGSRRSTKWLFALIGVFLFLCCGTIAILIIIAPILNGQIRQPAPSPSILSTAEAVVGVPHQIELPEISTILSVDVFTPEYYVCVEVSSESLTEPFLSHSKLYVNGSWAIGARYRIDGLPRQWCAVGILENGLHLIEFHLRDNSGETLHIQQWAIEVK